MGTITNSRIPLIFSLQFYSLSRQMTILPSLLNKSEPKFDDFFLQGVNEDITIKKDLLDKYLSNVYRARVAYFKNKKELEVKMPDLFDVEDTFYELDPDNLDDNPNLAAVKLF